MDAIETREFVSTKTFYLRMKNVYGCDQREAENFNLPEEDRRPADPFDIDEEARGLAEQMKAQNAELAEMLAELQAAKAEALE